MSQVLAAGAAILAATLAACVPEAGQVAPPTTQSGNATAAAVNASAQRALAEAEKARAAAQRAEAAAQLGRTTAATAEALMPRPADLDPARAWYRGEKPEGREDDPRRGLLSGWRPLRRPADRHEAQRRRRADRSRRGALCGRVAGRRDGRSRLRVPRQCERALRRRMAGRAAQRPWPADRRGTEIAMPASFATIVRKASACFSTRREKPVLAGNWDAGRQSAAAPPAGTAQRASYGSGFVVAANGAIVTNEHVVRGCTQIDVRQEDGSFAPASLVRADAAIDLAVIDMARPAAAVATFRDSATLREGEEIVVYGFPFAAQVSPGGTVTSGIVSSLFGPRGATHQLQITAPVQIGNSGGPLLDRQGRVVGIVQSKLNALSVARATGDLPQNVNFAVKSAPAMTLLRGAGTAPVQAGAQGADKRIADIVEAAKRFTVLVRCQR
jgi:S1-C subfamily serine protease